MSANLEKKKSEIRLSIVSSLSTSPEETSFKSAVPQIISAIIAASFHIQLGICLGYSAILIPQLEEPGSELQMSKDESSWIASIIVIVATIGSLMAGLLMECMGRMNVIKLAGVPCTIGWIMIAVATNFSTMFIGRLLTGLGCGLGTSPAVVYITEIARADVRGALNSIGPTLASLGMVIAYAKGAFIGWRLVAWFNLVYTIIPVVLIQLFVPESPVWLISKNKIKEASKSLEQLYRNYQQPKNSSQPVAEKYLLILIQEKSKRALEQAQTSEVDKSGEIVIQSKWKGFLNPTGYKPLTVMVLLFFIQQFSGIYITLFYAATFIQEIGTEINAYHASIFIGVVRFVMSLFNVWLLKKFKRLPLIMISTLGMAICMLTSGLFTLWIKEKKTEQTWVPVVCLLLYVFSSLMGLMTIPWTMSAEICSTKVKGSISHFIYFEKNAFL